MLTQPVRGFMHSHPNDEVWNVIYHIIYVRFDGRFFRRGAEVRAVLALHARPLRSPKDAVGL